MRKVGPVGIINEKTYVAEAVIGANLGVAHGAADGGVAPVTVAGQRCLGIATIPQTYLGGAVAVVRFGDALAIAGGAVNYLDYVKVDATGRVVSIAGTPGEEILGRAESSAVNPGDQLIVFVNPSAR